MNYFQVKCIMWQLFRGLESLHALGIVHRDLKASNVLVSHTGWPIDLY